jgi:UDP-N-acetyl-D-glucosamine dehydrogenase
VAGATVAYTSPKLCEDVVAEIFSDARVSAPPGHRLPDVEAIARRIAARTTRIGVVGLGYVGLPLACLAAERKFAVTGFEIDESKIAAVNRGKSYIRHVPDETIAALASSLTLRATADFSEISDTDIVLICAPTPLTQNREPDLSDVIRATESIATHLRPGHLIIFESTSYPGTTREVVLPILELAGLKSGVDFFLAYSAEREDPGNKDFTTALIPKVIGGDGPQALRLAEAFYQEIVPATVPVSTIETAEAVKLTENIFRAVNIALVNELKVIYDAMGIDIWEVIEAAKTKPFGYMPFYPGPGLGGHCIPIDPFYLTWKAREHDVSTQFIELAGQINNAMPRFVVERLATALSDRLGLATNGARILLVGLAYKKNIDDVRESPAFKIIDLLEQRAATVDYHDPFVPVIPWTREHAELAGRRSVSLTPAILAEYDAVLICTDHDIIDYGQIVGHARLVVDTRNACARAGATSERVVKA